MSEVKDVRRGFDPKDDVLFRGKALTTLRDALSDLSYLAEHDYNVRSALTLVGDHYRLVERQRLYLFRVLATKAQRVSRKARELSTLKGKKVHVDGFNTIITLETLLSGSMTYRSMDGTVKDLAGLRGSYRIIAKTESAIRIALESLQSAGASSVLFLFDSQVSNSGNMVKLVREVGASFPFPVDAQTDPAVDHLLAEEKCIVTSDSVLLDKCSNWYNLVGRIASSMTSAWVVPLLF